MSESDETPTEHPTVFDESAVNLLTFVTQYFNEHGEIISIEKATKDFGVPLNLITRCYGDKDFRAALEDRGIIFERIGTAWNSKSLTAQQLAMAEVMLDLIDTRSEKKKLQDAGIATATWNAWLRDPVFKDYLHKRAEQMLGDNKHEAHLALVDKARSGDVKALTLFYEITGRYTSQRAGASTVDMQHLIVSIIEIIDECVTDQETKLLIANKLKSLITARNMAAALTEAPVGSQGELSA